MTRNVLVFIFLLCSVHNEAKESVGNLKSYFNKANTTYEIRYVHQFTDTLFIPANCELLFNGGSLSGPIVFDKTTLSGKINLKGSLIHGTLKNERFDASWVCNKDGVTDDAHLINCILSVCNHIFFPKGRYRLITAFDPAKYVSKDLLSSVKCHLGINRNNITLQGEKGTELVTNKALSTICIFSRPKQIKHSIKNIVIDRITFTVENDGKHFYEFMHTIKTMGVDGLSIKNCNFNDFWGDAICLSHYGDDVKTGERTRNQNVKIENNTIKGGNHYNNRNGISVISGKNVLIKGNLIKNTSRKDMPGGICVEPNNSAYTIDNITIQKNTLEGVKGNGGAICVVLLRDNAPAHNIEIISNVIRNSTCGLTFVIKTENSSDNFVINDNYVDNKTNPYSFSGGGKTKRWKMLRNRFDKNIKQKIPGNIIIKDFELKNIK